MISVLIPIYNYNVVELVNDIQQQLELENVIFEIICIDDASQNFVEENDSLKNFENVKYYKLEDNIGRSKIRNLLVEKAKFNWLLFLDCDVAPSSKNFIKNYLTEIEKNLNVVCFGGVVNDKKKAYKNKELRHKYGVEREEISVDQRNESPYKYFLGANFLIPKSVFNKVQFNNDIITYGYEDFLFGENLKDIKVYIKHINNPVIHYGIDSSKDFLNKTKEALYNLNRLNEKYPDKFENVKLLKVFSIFKKLHLVVPFTFLFNLCNTAIKKQLLGKKPSLFLFDIYKLGCYCNVNSVSN